GIRMRTSRADEACATAPLRELQAGSIPRKVRALLLALAPLWLAGCSGSTPTPASPPSTTAPASPPSTTPQAKPSELADGAPAARPLSYFVGRWAGDFRGTQAGALLEVTAEGRFTFEVSTGPEPEQRCRLLGTLAIEGDLLDLTPESPPACHSWAEAKLGKQKLLSSDERSFEIDDVEYLD